MSFALIRRIGDDRVGVAIRVHRQGVLAGCDVAGIGAAQPEGFQMAHQRAVTAARLGKLADAAQVRDQRWHRSGRRRVEIARDSLEIGTLAHVARAVMKSLPLVFAAYRVGDRWAHDSQPRPHDRTFDREVVHAMIGMYSASTPQSLPDQRQAIKRLRPAGLRRYPLKVV